PPAFSAQGAALSKSKKRSVSQRQGLHDPWKVRGIPQLPTAGRYGASGGISADRLIADSSFAGRFIADSSIALFICRAPFPLTGYSACESFRAARNRRGSWDTRSLPSQRGS